MHIETTVYINKSLLNRLEVASQQLDISKSKLVGLLFDEVKKDQKLVKTFSRIRYQKRDASKDWHKLHLYLDFDLYELCLDVRKLFKMSVSFVLAYAIENYLDEILCGNCTDNSGRAYCISFREYSNSSHFIISWGFPEDNILKYLLE